MYEIRISNNSAMVSNQKLLRQFFSRLLFVCVFLSVFLSQILAKCIIYHRLQVAISRQRTNMRDRIFHPAEKESTLDHKTNIEPVISIGKQRQKSCHLPHSLLSSDAATSGLKSIKCDAKDSQYSCKMAA